MLTAWLRLNVRGWLGGRKEEILGSLHSKETPWLPCILYVNCWREGNCKHWGEEQPLFRSEVLSAPYRKMTAPFAQNFMAASTREKIFKAL